MSRADPPKSIDISKEPPGLIFEWADGLKKMISFRTLREQCPCALCRGEQTPLDQAPMELPVVRSLAPEATVCKDMYKVGAYALGFKWGDGHDTGIYSFEYLRALAEDLP